MEDVSQEQKMKEVGDELASDNETDTTDIYKDLDIPAVSDDEDILELDASSEVKSAEKPTGNGVESSEKEKSSERENGKDKIENSKLANTEDDDVITVEDSTEISVPDKTVSDTEFFENVSEEEKEHYAKHGVEPDSIEDMNIQCTACWKQVNHHQRNSIQRHALLGVPVCRACKYFYEDDGVWEKDEQGSDCYCRWCANGGEMVCCDKCSNSFCKQCIQRNLGRKFFNKINECEFWECFQCKPEPIYSQRSLMFAISKWYILRKDKKKTKEKEQKQKTQKKAMEIEEKKVENFVDENINEAFDTLRIYQKCLEDERKRWIKNKKAMNPDTCATIVSKLRKIYCITRQNMDLLENALVQGYSDKFPEEPIQRIKPGKIPGVAVSPKGKPAPKSSPEGTQPSNVKTVNKRKMKNTSNNIVKKIKAADEGDIAVEEIVLDGAAVLGNREILDPSQLCSIQITGVAAPAPPRIGPVKRVLPPSAPLRISSKMFKKKSPSKPAAARPLTPDSDIEEITIIEDDEPVAASRASDADSDVSLDF